VFRYKDVKGWWANPHYDRIAGIEQATPTAWTPQSKPIWFTEIGCPAIDKGANQPNVFWDPKSSESYAPYYSAATRDDLIQHRYIETFLAYWQVDNNKNPVSTVYGAPMVDLSRAHIWSWDARPFPEFPARLDVWSDGDNWHTGHWISGRTGLVSLADIVSDVSISSGANAPDVSDLLGMVSGYVLDRPMSARAALTPLSRLYGFDLVERAGGLSFASRGTQSVFAVESDGLVYEQGNGTFNITRQDAETRLKDVRINFIDQAKDYQSGLVLARDLFAETEKIIDISAPLILDAGQAKVIANSLLEQVLGENETIEFGVPPLLLGLESGDVLRVGGIDGQWQITNLDGLGARTAQARRMRAGTIPITTGVAPGVVATPDWVSAPEGYALDIADFTGEGIRSGPLVGVIVNPFANTHIAEPSSAGVDLAAPVRIGALLEGLPSGPVGRFDLANGVDILLPGVALAALSDADIFAGGNLLAIETPQGWEILQAADIELVGVDTYRISRLLRGQYGTDHVLGFAVQAGARVVYLGQGWQDISLNADLRGNDIDFTLSASGRENTENFVLNYQANHLRPLSPVHIKAARVDDTIDISWIRRTRIGGDDWASLDVSLGEESEVYEVKFLDEGVTVLVKDVTTTSLQIPITEMETLYGSPLGEITITVSQISQKYGRGAVRQFAFDI